MALYLGVDGGGSGCRAVLADAQGRVLARAEGGPANINSGPELAIRNILAVTGAVLAEAGVTADRVAAGLGLAGGNVGTRKAAVLAALPFARVRVESDGWTAARGALGTEDGVVAAFGTGSVYAVQRGGEITLAGGWGWVLGDEGGGAGLGRAVLAALLRAVDGLPPGITPLGQRLLDRLGGPHGVVGFADSAGPADLARLAPEVAAGGDALAELVLDGMQGEITAMLAHLNAGGTLPLVYLGGLGQLWRDRLGLPSVEPRGNALDGALMLAREGDG
jgi:glucosamine kinase